MGWIGTCLLSFRRLCRRVQEEEGTGGQVDIAQRWETRCGAERKYWQLLLRHLVSSTRNPDLHSSWLQWFVIVDSLSLLVDNNYYHLRDPIINYSLEITAKFHALQMMMVNGTKKEQRDHVMQPAHWPTDSNTPSIINRSYWMVLLLCFFLSLIYSSARFLQLFNWTFFRECFCFALFQFLFNYHFLPPHRVRGKPSSTIHTHSYEWVANHHHQLQWVSKKEQKESNRSSSSILTGETARRQLRLNESESALLRGLVLWHCRPPPHWSTHHHQSFRDAIMTYDRAGHEFVIPTWLSFKTQRQKLIFRKCSGRKKKSHWFCFH